MKAEGLLPSDAPVPTHYMGKPYDEQIPHSPLLANGDIGNFVYRRCLR